MKKFIMEQVEKRLPDQAELIKNNIDMMMGILKLESTEKAVYTLSPDGRAKKIVVVNTTAYS